MSTRKFTRNIENFDCEHCGARVLGNGCTNHCPQCLWSKHVDLNPGDRANVCRGAMEPIGAVIKPVGNSIIVQRCQRCGMRRQNRVDRADDMSVVIGLSARPLADEI